jgi:hypothetical protein
MGIRRRRALGLAFVLPALCAAGPASALAAPTPIAAERILIDFKGKKGDDPDTLSSRLAGNCIDVSALSGWSVDFDGIDGTWASTSLDARGSIDAVSRRGSVTPKPRGSGLLFRTFGRVKRPSLQLTKIGVELAGKRAYMTGRLSRSSAQFTAAKVQRVGLIRRPKLLIDQLHDAETRQDIPNTFAIAVQGKVRITKVFARELERRRCHELASQGAGPVRAGRAIGRLTAQFKAGAATGLVGSVPLRADFLTTADGARVTVADINGVPIPADEGADATITLATAAGNLTPLDCIMLTDYPGQACAPLGGVVTLADGIVLRLGDRSTTIAGISLAYAADARSDSFPSRTLSATIDGAPVTFGSSPAGRPGLTTTPQALAALGAALGTEVDGFLLPGDLTFTSVGPP